ncbi:serine/threonine-protein kinase [Actinomadura terrae]|uniref:serine/threonine-protein kinase n=1 Tax=Actinomadura terrae TaxID=604353 RepID=UPI00234310A9|nr:protein kinase [Actinomadura terrae]
MASPLPLDASDPTRLGGCELLGRIGTGGQGVVFLGRPLDPAAGLPPLVAVKLLHTRLLGDDAARARFVRELALLQRVAGFCTAQMLAADTAGDRPYIVSEYVEGRSLNDLVLEEGPRTGADLDRLAISSVTALTAIHRAGIVHRDFKPHNVLMGRDGPRVIDFGIARAYAAGATLTSQVVGTPAYMAPEQFAGRIGPATDLFAWAATLLFAATARDPFAGGSVPAVMYRILHETPDLSALPAPIAEVAGACLARDPADRPTAEQVLMRLLGEYGAPHTPHDFSAPPALRPTTPIPSPRTPVPTRTLDQGAVPAPRPSPTRAPAPGPAQGFAPAPGRGTGSGPGSTYKAGSGRGGGSALVGGAGEGTSTRKATAELDRGGEPAAGSGGAAGPFVPASSGARTRTRELRRGAATVVGLVLAGFLAALDVASLAILIARPSLTEGHRGGLLPVVATSFTVLAAVTLVAVILAWRGSRAGAWTAMAARVTRVALWGAWGALVSVDAAALAGHAAVTALVVVLLAAGLRSSPR